MFLLKILLHCFNVGTNVASNVVWVWKTNATFWVNVAFNVAPNVAFVFPSLKQLGMSSLKNGVVGDQKGWSNERNISRNIRATLLRQMLY